MIYLIGIRKTGGGGAIPLSSDLTDGGATFIIQTGHDITGAASAINIGSLTIQSGATYDVGAFSLTVNSTAVQVDGTFDDTSAGGTNTFAAGLTVGASGSFTPSLSIQAIEGNVTNNGTFSVGSGAFVTATTNTQTWTANSFYAVKW